MGQPTDEEARQHMRRCPDHEITIDANDEWRCLTCEGVDKNDIDVRDVVHRRNG